MDELREQLRAATTPLLIRIIAANLAEEYERLDELTKELNAISGAPVKKHHATLVIHTRTETNGFSHVSMSLSLSHLHP